MNQTNEERLRAYPDPKIEKQQLHIFQKMVQVTQSLLDRQNRGINQTTQEPWNEAVKEIKPKKGSERHSKHKTRKKLSATQEPTKKLPAKETQKETRNEIKQLPFARTQKDTMGLNDEVVPIIVSNTETSKETEQWVHNLWKEIRENKLKEIPEEKAHIKELDLDKSQLNIETESRYADCGLEESVESRVESLRTLPSFIEEFDKKSDVRKVPTHYKFVPPVLDATNLHALLSTLVRVTMPLADVLKVKPELWEGITKAFEHMGIRIPSHEMSKSTNESEQQKRVNCKPVPIKKVGDYYEGEDGNTMLPVEFNNVKSLAILDSGAGVAIATKQIWDSWGQLALSKTRMQLQLVDEYVERPLGLLEKVVVSSCNIEYEHLRGSGLWHKTKLRDHLKTPIHETIENDTRLGL